MRISDWSSDVCSSDLTGGVSLRFGRLVHAAWSGDQPAAIEMHAVAIQEATARGNSAEVALAEHAVAALHNGLGNYPAALAAAERASESLEPPHATPALPALVEAAARPHHNDRALAADDHHAAPATRREASRG